MSSAQPHRSPWTAEQGSAASAAWTTTVSMPPTLETTTTTASPESREAYAGALPVLRDGSQHLLAGGSEGDGDAGGGHGGPKGEPRRPPPEPNPLLGQLAHAGWASSLTANLCLPQVGQSKRETLVFERIRSVEAPARIRACKCPHIRGPGRAPRSLVCRICRA